MTIIALRSQIVKNIVFLRAELGQLTKGVKSVQSRFVDGIIATDTDIHNDTQCQST